MNHSIFACVCIILIVIFTLILLKRSIGCKRMRQNAGFYKKDVYAKECGWLSNLIWARKVSTDDRWIIYSKSGYVTDNKDTVQFKDILANLLNPALYPDHASMIYNHRALCPEISGRNHIDDIQSAWFKAIGEMLTGSRDYIALPCIYSFIARDAGCVEGSMHVAASIWAAKQEPALTIAILILGP